MGMDHFLVASKVERYNAFNNAPSLGKTLRYGSCRCLISVISDSPYAHPSSLYAYLCLLIGGNEKSQPAMYCGCFLELELDNANPSAAVGGFFSLKDEIKPKNDGYDGNDGKITMS